MENYDVKQFKHDPEEKFKLADIKKFTLIYYMLTINCFFGFGVNIFFIYLYLFLKVFINLKKPFINFNFHQFN